MEMVCMEKVKYPWVMSIVWLLSLIGGISLCQPITNGQDSQENIGMNLRKSVLSQLQKEDNPEWQVVWNENTKVAKRLFNAESKPFPGTPQDVARGFLSQYHGLFGFNPGLEDLRIIEDENTPLGWREKFQQYYQDIPVIDAEVTVHVSDKNGVFLVENRYIPNLKIDIKPAVENGSAIITARDALKIQESDVESVSSKLVILPNISEPQLAWRVIISKKENVEKTWLVYVDAKRKGWVLYKKLLQAYLNGKGKVYKENPVTTPSLSSARLKNLSTGTKLLKGKYAATYNAECANAGEQVTTASSPTRNYSYKPNDDRLSEVMAYYHVNTEHDKLKSLFSFKKLDNQIPLLVNLQDPFDESKGFDNAFYTRSTQFEKTGLIVYGCGEIFKNFALDGNISQHEYGHAVLDHIQPQFFEAIESNYPGAIHEHTGDVMASYFGGNALIGEYAGVSKDGKVNITRNMDNTRKYPGDVYDPELNPPRSEVHYTGEILNGVYWDIKGALGVDTAFKLFFSALNLLPNDPTFFDLRDAWVTADSQLYKGKNKNAIQMAFANHGITGKDPGNAKAKLALLDMTFFKYDPNTGKLTQQTTFKQGDYIVIFIKTKVSQLTPAYNIIPESISLTQADKFNGQIFSNEALNGTYDIAFAIITTNSAIGTINVQIKERLGGTTSIKSITGSFKMATKK